MIQLYNNDCFEEIKRIADNSVDMVFTDPPYYFRGRQGRKSNGPSSILGRCETFKDGNPLFYMGSFDGKSVYKLLDECNRVMKVFRGYFFCNEYLVPYYTMWALEHKCLFNIITLSKPLSIINRNRYSTNTEFMIRIYKGASINILDYSDNKNNIKWLSSVQEFNKIQNRQHPAQKPLDIIEGVLALNTKGNDTILDMFMGSGSIGVVAKRMGRNYIGIERDEQYFNIARDRINGTVI